ncbi:MAG: biopolymer transporter ExbD [Bacteroidales bacterium]|jgi:biopolymer transport protein ExbD|nr:biopolymer transporter ExbD [Bacteroidales bacterium]MDD2687126.1 biopolymer transporter ExbD [Bacteroidales bacterium]MDD3331321.1 biopolymer transporter ExbD [Bacteroidales bacterium]MDD3691437.1 biopolymer transporter ExbD [Bacteroidales bacterium]MDD4044913.1 biopolymer transporter ExbD [Bacteroidales bacterium]
MGRFKKEGKKDVPELNMGSMSDIIFMFLFFFMVITTMRESSLFVVIQIPKATEVQKLEKKALVSSINIGRPNQNHIKRLGPEPRIQLNDQFAEYTDIIEFVEAEKQRRNELDRTMITWSLKVDEKVKMGIVTDVKQELRKASAFKVNYATRKDITK